MTLPVYNVFVSKWAFSMGEETVNSPLGVPSQRGIVVGYQALHVTSILANQTSMFGPQRSKCSRKVSQSKAGAPKDLFRRTMHAIKCTRD